MQGLGFAHRLGIKERSGAEWNRIGPQALKLAGLAVMVMSRAGIRAGVRIALVVLAGAMVAGCGARGALEPPPGAAARPSDQPVVLDTLL